ncbi:hypothetical protein [Funiculus sociatus]
MSMGRVCDRIPTKTRSPNSILFILPFNNMTAKPLSKLLSSC